MFVSINDAADITIPPENKNRYTSPFTQIYEQTAALESVVNYIKDQQDLEKWFKKYKTCNPQKLAYYICLNGDMKLQAKRVIRTGNRMNEHVEYTPITFDDKFLENFWVHIKDQDDYIQ